MADPDRQREILERVASGELTPEEAAELLAQAEADGAEADSGEASTNGGPSAGARDTGRERPTGTDTDGASARHTTGDRAGAAPTAGATPPAAGAPSADDTPTSSAKPGAAPDPAASTRSTTSAAPAAPAASADDPDAIVAVRVRSNCRAVSIVGDPDVRTAVAEGDHVARVEGRTLTIESTLDRSPGFAFMRTPGRARTMVKVGAQHVRPLTVRMNPDLALDSQMDAGSLTIRDVRGPIRAHTSAGALRIDGFEGPLELRIAAGSATARGRLTHGASRIECDAGKVSVRLSADSNVTVRGRVNLGQFNAPDQIGNGDAELDIVATLGAVDVGLEDDDDDFADADADAMD